MLPEPVIAKMVEQTVKAIEPLQFDYDDEEDIEMMLLS